MAKEAILTDYEKAYIIRRMKYDSVGQIAEKLGRHYNTIYKFIKKSRENVNHTFTDKEDEFIKQNYGNMRAEVVARTLNVTVSQVYNRARNLGVKKFARK